MKETILAWFGKWIPAAVKEYGLWETAKVLLLSILVIAIVFLAFWHSGIFTGMW